MADAGFRVWLLAGRVGPGEAGPICRLAHHLRAAGIEAAVLCVARGADLPGVAEVIECPGLGDRWRRPWAVRGLAAGAPARPPDLLHVLGAGLDLAGLALAEQLGVPYVLTVDDYIPDGGRLRLGRRWCRALIATGPGLADDLARSLGVSRGWINVIAPGLDAPPPEPCQGGMGRVPVVGSAATLAGGSGVPTFLDAARRVVASGRDVEFVVAGEGPGEADLRRVADRLGVAGRVTFAAPPDGAGTFWRVLDVFCAPTLRPSAGRALAEALAHGVPSIASDVEGHRRWVEPGATGLVVPPGDADALADAVLGLLDDPARAAALGRAARERIARDFDPAREAAELLAVYRRALAVAGRPAIPAAPGPAASRRS